MNRENAMATLCAGDVITLYLECDDDEAVPNGFLGCDSGRSLLSDAAQSAQPRLL